MTDTTATVVVLFRNDGPVLARTIDGLRGQVVSSTFEVVLVDSSADESGASFIGDVTRGPWEEFVVIRAPEGLTPGAARNRGIRASRGQYIAFLAADCIPDPSWLERRLQRHREGFAAVAGSVACAPPKRLWQLVQWFVRFGGAYPSRSSRTDRLPRFGWSYDRELLRDGFREDLFASEDRVLNEQLLVRGTRVIFDPSIRIGHVGLGSFSQILAHQRHHGREAAALADNQATQRPMAKYQLSGLAVWYPPLRWLRGLPSAAAAGPVTAGLYVITLPYQLAAYAAWAKGFTSARKKSTSRSASSSPRGWIVEEFGRGGIARYAVDVANLLGSNSPITVATTSSGPAPGIDPAHRVDVWFPSVGGGLSSRVAAGMVGLSRALTRPHKGDWAWIQVGIRPTFELLLAVALKFRGARVVCTIHNRAPHTRSRSSPLVIATARFCRFVVVHNRHMSGWAEGVGLRVVTLPFPTPDVTHAERAGIHSRRSLDLEPDDVVLLSFGNLSRYKGITELVRAFGALAAQDPETPIKLVLAGQQRDSGDPSELAAATGVGEKIRRIDKYLEDGEIADLLELADAVVFPYLHADHSGSATLAASMGLRALASDLPALRELFDGRAIFVKPGSVMELTEGLSLVPDFLAVDQRSAGGPCAPPQDAYRALGEMLMSGRTDLLE